MYNKFDVCISDFSHESDPSDYWYDCAILEATEMLNKFNNNDWELLLSQIKLKPIFWQKRLVECLGDLHNSHELDVLLNIINTNSEELFISCIDSLRLLDLSNLDKSEKKSILFKIDILLQNASSPVKSVLEELIKKLVE